MEDLATPFDLVVVGAGINGLGIARDAARRGLRVVILEQDDIRVWYQALLETSRARCHRDNGKATSQATTAMAIPA